MPVRPKPLSIIKPNKTGEIALEPTVIGCTAALISPSQLVPYFSANNALVLLVIIPEASPKNEKNKIRVIFPLPNQRQTNPINKAKCPIKQVFFAETRSIKNPDRNAPKIAANA